VKISVVIPCRNEENYIIACVLSVIQAAEHVVDVEVLAVDGASTDSTLERLNLLAQSNAKIRILSNLNQVTPSALNIGIQAATGDYIMILGAHSKLHPSYFSEALNVLNHQPNADCIGGKLIVETQSQKEKCIALAMSSKFGVGNALFRTGAKAQYVDTVAFGIYKKLVFEKIGLFNETLIRNQDDEFNFRMHKAGLTIYFDPALKITYYPRSDFEKLYHQYFQYGYWKVYVNQLHKAFVSVRQLVPPLFILSLVLGIALSFVSALFAKIFMGYVMVYLAAGYFSASRVADNNIEVNYIWQSYVILHISYGLGYWKGLLDFILLRKQPKKHEALTR
jgi:glycosyltransferase involved in cell wall biosynthesis